MFSSCADYKSWVQMAETGAPAQVMVRFNVMPGQGAFYERYVVFMLSVENGRLAIYDVVNVDSRGQASSALQGLLRLQAQLKNRR